jgi:hypothetical protein
VSDEPHQQQFCSLDNLSVLTKANYSTHSSHFCSASSLLSFEVSSVDPTAIHDDDSDQINPIYFNQDKVNSTQQLTYYNSFGRTQSTNFDCSVLPECKVSVNIDFSFFLFLSTDHLQRTR